MSSRPVQRPHLKPVVIRRPGYDTATGHGRFPLPVLRAQAGEGPGRGLASRGPRYKEPA